MKLVNIGLVVIIGVLVFLLYQTIREPIKYKKEKDVRYEMVKNRLKNIRTAQLAFKEINGTFASNFDSLVNCIKMDSFQVVKTIGNPDDSTIETSYDTFYVSLLDSIFPVSFNVDSLSYIPFGHGKQFELNAGAITKQKVEVQVFEVNAPDSVFLRDLLGDYRKYINTHHVLSVGSMEEATITGNWE